MARQGLQHRYRSACAGSPRHASSKASRICLLLPFCSLACPRPVVADTRAVCARRKRLRAQDLARSLACEVLRARASGASETELSLFQTRSPAHRLMHTERSAALVSSHIVSLLLLLALAIRLLELLGVHSRLINERAHVRDVVILREPHACDRARREPRERVKHVARVSPTLTLRADAALRCKPSQQVRRHGRDLNDSRCFSTRHLPPSSLPPPPLVAVLLLATLSALRRDSAVTQLATSSCVQAKAS